MLKRAKNILGGAKLPIPVSCIIVANFCRGGKIFFKGGSTPRAPPLGCGPAFLVFVGYSVLLVIIEFKSNLHYTHRIKPKRVTSCGANLRGLAPGQHSFEETSQRWRVVGNTVPI